MVNNIYQKKKGLDFRKKSKVLGSIVMAISDTCTVLDQLLKVTEKCIIISLFIRLSFSRSLKRASV